MKKHEPTQSESQETQQSAEASYWAKRALSAEKQLMAVTEQLDLASDELRISAVKISALEAERNHQAEVMLKMKAEFDALKRMYYGKRSEKMPSISSELKGKKGKKGKDPKDTKDLRKKNKDKKKDPVTQVDIEHNVDLDGPPCPNCGNDRHDFKSAGTRETHLFEFIPARFEYQVHLQEVLACPCKQHIIVADGPVKLGGGGGNYGAGFVSHVMVTRAWDSIPFHRMEKQFERIGIPISRTTMCSNFHRYAPELQPIVDIIFQRIAQAEIVHADETPHVMQKKGNTDKSGKGYMWVFIAGDLFGYKFSSSRSGETPRKVLGGTRGSIIVDAYTGYNVIATPEQRERAGCWAHARRKFFDAMKSGVDEAQEALDFILELYQVEHEVKEQELTRTDQHLELRRARCGPTVKTFRDWLESRQNSYPPKSPMGKAIGYARNNWEALQAFLSSAKIPLDNNISERALRVVALSRKNSLFIGNDDAGSNLAIVMTLCATCDAAGVNPQEYLADVLLRVHAMGDLTMEQLLPASWLELKTAGKLPPVNYTKETSTN